jgi:hypothetical protein
VITHERVREAFTRILGDGLAQRRRLRVLAVIGLGGVLFAGLGGQTTPLFDALVLAGVFLLGVALRGDGVTRPWVLGVLVGVFGVGLLLGGCNFAGGLWGATEDIFGPMLFALVQQIGSIEDTALEGNWDTVTETLGPLGVVVRNIQSTLGGQFQSTCG